MVPAWHQVHWVHGDMPSLTACLQEKLLLAKQEVEAAIRPGGQNKQVSDAFTRTIPALPISCQPNLCPECVLCLSGCECV